MAGCGMNDNEEDCGDALCCWDGTTCNECLCEERDSDQTCGQDTDCCWDRERSMCMDCPPGQMCFGLDCPEIVATEMPTISPTETTAAPSTSPTDSSDSSDHSDSQSMDSQSMEVADAHSVWQSLDNHQSHPDKHDYSFDIDLNNQQIAIIYLLVVLMSMCFMYLFIWQKPNRRRQSKH